MTDYVICVRRIKSGVFDAEPSEPGKARFLEVPGTADDITPAQENTKTAEWTNKVLADAKTIPGGDSGDILFFVHGFNTPTETVLDRHRKVKNKLVKAGFKGVVVSFDWPSDDKAINYLEDRWDAKKSAIKLVEQGIKRFAKYQREGCEINLHVLAHSMGAYVLREAFDDADDVAGIAAVNWSVSQVMILSGDISARSLGEHQSKSSSLYRHTVRLTNYFNPYDDVLKLSNVKRIGVSPRVGRIGLPDTIPQKAVNLNCGAYFKKHETGFGGLKYAGHTWYFEDQRLFDDICATIKGDIDRHMIPTRAPGSDGGLHLAP